MTWESQGQLEDHILRSKLKVESAKLDIVTTGNIPPTIHMAKEKDGATDYQQK